MVKGSAFDVFGEDRQPVFADLGKAAADFDRFGFGAFGLVDLHRAVADRRHQRRMAFEHTEFAFRTGLPAKSGVGGGILAIVPGRASVAVWSPGLNAYGNSKLGTEAMELLARAMDWSVF